MSASAMVAVSGAALAGIGAGIYSLPAGLIVFGGLVWIDMLVGSLREGEG